MNGSRDLCRKAQLSLLPDSAIDQLCIALQDVPVHEVYLALLMNDVFDEDRPQSLRQCLRQLCELPKPSSCMLICASPALHFNARR